MNWLTDYSYRKNVNITGSVTDPVSNYQMLLEVGASAGGDVHCDGECFNFPEDIAFTSADGATEIDFWIEDKAADPIKVWIEAPSIPISPGTAKIYMYYRKSGAVSESNGDATFRFFDDFEGVSLDLTKWTPSGLVSVAGSIVTLDRSGSDAEIATKDAMNVVEPFIVEAKYQHPSRYRNRLYLTTAFSGGSPTGYDYGIFSPEIYWNGNTGFNLSLSTWYIVKWINTTTNYTWKILTMAGAEVISKSHGSAIADAKYLTFVGTENDASDFKLDWVYARKFIDPEPTWGAWSASEAWYTVWKIKDLLAYYDIKKKGGFSVSVGGMLWP